MDAASAAALRATLLGVSKKDSTRSDAYSALGGVIGRDERIKLPDGRKMSRRELCIEALRLAPSTSLFYYNLAVSISVSERVSLADGRALGQRELLLEALRLDPLCAGAYGNLIFSLSPPDRAHRAA